MDNCLGFGYLIFSSDYAALNKHISVGRSARFHPSPHAIKPLKGTLIYSKGIGGGLGAQQQNWTSRCVVKTKAQAQPWQWLTGRDVKLITKLVLLVVVYITPCSMVYP